MSFPKKEFHGTRREDFQSIEAYIEKLKSVADSLAEINSPISDSDMVLQLVAGLPTQYLPLKNTISSRCPLPNFEEACSMLCMHEDIFLQVSSVQDDQIRRAQLEVQFHGTRREDFQTIEAYVKKLKSVSDSLAEINSPISDSDMVLQLLAGLPTQYLPLKNTISSRCPLPNFEEVCSMLYMQEDILLQEQITSDPGVGAEQSSTFCRVYKFVSVVDKVNTLYAAAGTVLTVASALGLGTAVAAVGTVGASRMIVFGAVSAVGGWKVWQTFHRK